MPLNEHGMFHTPEKLQEITDWCELCSAGEKVAAYTASMMMHTFFVSKANGTAEMFQKLLAGGMMISVNPQAPHEFGLVACPTDDSGEYILNGMEIVCCHEDWVEFIKLCQEYVE